MRSREVAGRLACTAMAGLALSFPASALKVCADPDYLPYSNRAQQGFENKVAAAAAKWLREPLEYTWASYRGHGGFPQFLSANLDASTCDVVMSIPYGSPEELTTRPYYISSYVFVFARNRNYSIQSMDSPALRRLKIGIERDTPAEEGLKIRGLIPGTVTVFDVSEDSSQSPMVMLNALERSQIDVLITWQPAIGAFLRKYPDFEVVAVPNTRALGAPEQYTFPMSMGLREKDETLKARLDRMIQQHQNEIASIMSESGVRLYKPE